MTTLMRKIDLRIAATVCPMRFQARLVKTVALLTAMALMAAVSGRTNAQAAKTTVSAYDQDLAAFKRLRGNLADLAAEIGERTDLFGSRPADDTTLLRPEIRRQVLSLWYPLVDTYLAMDALAQQHMHFHQLKTKAARRRSFHLARGVFLTQYRIALEVIAVLEQNSVMDTILNEAEPSVGLPKGVYSQFKYQYLNVIKAGRYAALEAVARVYGQAEDPQVAQWAEADSRIILAAGKGPGPRMTFRNGLAIIKRFGDNAWFPVQKEVAQWMGHTKVWRPGQYLIQPHQIQTLAGRLEPGDILLERREWYLTNVGIPGFWTHAALFIGSPAQRDALSKAPAVKAWLEANGVAGLDDLIKARYPHAWAALQRPCKDGLQPQVIEALAPGVSLTSLQHSAGCDSLAVLRPRLSKRDRASAVLRAMRYYGRPYDYRFDFGSDTSLVCTELIVKAYLEGEMKIGLDLPLENLMGHMVTPANAFARQFDERYGTPEQQMELILFWDGDEKRNTAVESDLSAFRASWNRPKWHILMQYTPSGGAEAQE